MGKINTTQKDKVIEKIANLSISYLKKLEEKGIIKIIQEKNKIRVVKAQ